MAITKGDGKKEVRFIALLVAFIWTTFTILGVVVLTTDSAIPRNVTFIRVCKGEITATFNVNYEGRIISN